MGWESSPCRHHITDWKADILMNWQCLICNGLRFLPLSRIRQFQSYPYNNLDKSSLSIIHFKPILHLSYPYILPLTSNLKLVWHAGCLSNANDETDIPNWSGFMHYCSTPATGAFPPVADIRMLPIIDMNPNDLSCIF